MEQLTVLGGRPLQGTVDIHGAKNSALPIMAACLAAGERSIITGCPELWDTESSAQILRHLGCRVERIATAMVVDAADAGRTQIPPELMGKLRASVNYLGALLTRCGRCTLSLPGGCSLGGRPIDYHISALQKLGVQLEEDGSSLHFSWPHRHGGEICLPFPSVGATENILLAALSVPDTVIVYGAAKEPEIADLCAFLNDMGGEICGAGTDTLVICGGRRLHGAVHALLPDRMEAATYLAMTASCGGKIRLRNIAASHLQPVLLLLEKAGCRIHTSPGEITLIRDRPLCGIGSVETGPYPGFPTDAQAPCMAAMLCASGRSRFTETVFPARFRHVAQLLRFGACITEGSGWAEVSGVPQLHASKAEATDLRGGAGLLIAALQAEGKSVIYEAELLKRGYSELQDNLRNLGADVYFESSADCG